MLQAKMVVAHSAPYTTWSPLHFTLLNQVFNDQNGLLVLPCNCKQMKTISPTYNSKKKKWCLLTTSYSIQLTKSFLSSQIESSYRTSKKPLSSNYPKTRKRYLEVIDNKTHRTLYGTIFLLKDMLNNMNKKNFKFLSYLYLILLGDWRFLLEWI